MRLDGQPVLRPEDLLGRDGKSLAHNPIAHVGRYPVAPLLSAMLAVSLSHNSYGLAMMGHSRTVRSRLSQAGRRPRG
jgi:hypothetical protein